MSQQQTVLRVQLDNVNTSTGITQYDFLDLYSSIPIAVTKSFAELGDIGKRNSDYSVGVMLPGSKKNNAFFENFFNVDAQSLYFNPNKRVPCNVLINDEAYFTGYLRLNKISVKDSAVEYDVTLFSTPAELYGSIGNNLLKDLDFNDSDYQFNHIFNLDNVTRAFTYSNYTIDGEQPYPYMYPVVHNGYLYDTGNTVNFTGGTILERTRLYTSTSPLDSYVTLAAAYAAGVQEYRINSPTQGPYNNQLKAGLSVWNLLQLMFKTQGYQITSDFFNTPWMKTLYLYGYFSSDNVKFSWTIYEIQSLPIEGVEVFFVPEGTDVLCVVAKLGTGIPVFCDEDINVRLFYFNDYTYEYYPVDAVIPYGTSGITVSDIGLPFVYGESSQVPNGTSLSYLPKAVGDSVTFVDGDYVDFSLVIDQNIKQIDLLSSIAKKFNLVLIPDPDDGYKIRIEPYDYFIGTGVVHNWTDKLSFDKGFSVQPALNFIESELFISDSEDSDEGNAQFRKSNNRIYGQNIVYNPTDFKSQRKEITTIFGPQLLRKWDADNTNNISLPLGINYVSNSSEAQGNQVNWQYNGVKTKPKLFWYLGAFNPFLDVVGETYDATYYYKTYVAYISNSSGDTFNQFDRLPVISHTMPMGMTDRQKINNDSQCILFNSELPVDTTIGVQPYNTYTENDAYTSFYQGRVSNLYNPNTRVLTGYFDLNYSDIKNLQPQDLIKVNEQYFVVSKINDFNLTNRELSQVELIQFNNSPKTYTDRYFQYYYCDNPSKIYKFKTYFTEPNLLDSNFGWSIYYDHQVGNLSGQTSGFTSSFKYVQGFSTTVYTPYTMYEVDEATYNTSGIDWDSDTLHNHIYDDEIGGPFQYSMPTFWLNSGSTRQGSNLFTNCDNFYSTASTWGILTGSSTYFGVALTPTPTPTPTITPSGNIAGLMRGSLLISYDEPNVFDRSPDLEAYVNGVQRNLIHNPIDNLYTTYIYSGDVVNILMRTTSNVNSIDVVRRDYTTDDQGGDNGIRDTFITGTTGASVADVYQITFTATTVSTDYNFEYRVDAITSFPVTPTPTPTITPTNTGSPTPTPTNTPTPSPVYQYGKTFIVGTFDGNLNNSNVIINQSYGDITAGPNTNFNNQGRLNSVAISDSGYAIMVLNPVIGNPKAYFSGDNGINWGQYYDLSGVIDLNKVTISSDGQYQSILYGLNTGFYYSSNYGGSWTNFSTIYNISRLEIGSGNYQYATTTADGTTEFFTKIRRIDVSNGSNTILTGLTFNPAPYGGIIEAYEIDVTYDNKNIGFVYYTYDNDTQIETTNLAVSTNSGSTFSTVLSTTADNPQGKIVSIGKRSNYIATNIDSGIGSFRLSSDMGQNWSLISPAIASGYTISNIKLSATGKDIAILGFGADRKLFVSNDYGSTWNLELTQSQSATIDKFNFGGSNYQPTPTPTPTLSATPTNTPTNTVTPSVTPTNTPTNTLTPTNTPTNTVTKTPTVTPTNTKTPTVTPTNTVTPTRTPTKTPTPTGTQTPTPTPTTPTYTFIRNFYTGFIGSCVCANNTNCTLKSTYLNDYDYATYVSNGNLLSAGMKLYLAGGASYGNLTTLKEGVTGGTKLWVVDNATDTLVSFTMC